MKKTDREVVGKFIGVLEQMIKGSEIKKIFPETDEIQIKGRHKVSVETLKDLQGSLKERFEASKDSDSQERAEKDFEYE